MKRVLFIFATLFIILCLVACSQNGNRNIIGKWSCELYGSEQIIEFTSDGSFIDHTSGSINRYLVSDGKIVTYVEDAPDSKVAIEYKIKNDTLTFGNIEYKKITVSDNK